MGSGAGLLALRLIGKMIWSQLLEMGGTQGLGAISIEIYTLFELWSLVYNDLETAFILIAGAWSSFCA